MAKLVELLPKIIHSGDTTTVEQNIDCNGFLPSKSCRSVHFKLSITYHISLTLLILIIFRKQVLLDLSRFADNATLFGNCYLDCHERSCANF